MGEGGTQSNKVHKFALNDVSVSTVLSKIVASCDLYYNINSNVKEISSVCLGQFVYINFAVMY